MPLIEFVNYWRVSVEVRRTERRGHAWTSYLVQPLASSRRSAHPAEKHRRQKSPATLNLEDKWMVSRFNCLLTPRSVGI